MFVDGISFNVRGTTFRNEKGINIQEGIKQVLNEYKREGYIDKEDLYGGNSNSDIKELDLNVSEYEDIEFGGRIKKDTYKGEECYKVYISRIYGIDEYQFVNMDFNEIDDNYFHIGNVPKEDIEELNKILTDNKAKQYRVSIKIVGGKYKHSVYDDYEDKERIETKTLTYGFEVTVYTDDGKEEIKEVKKEVKTEIKNEDKKEIENSTKTNNKVIKKDKKKEWIGLISFAIMLFSSFFLMPLGIILSIFSFSGFLIFLLLLWA